MGIILKKGTFFPVGKGVYRMKREKEQEKSLLYPPAMKE